MTTAKIWSGGTVVEVLASDAGRPFQDMPMLPMMEAAAIADLDAWPITTENLQTAQRVPRESRRCSWS